MTDFSKYKNITVDNETYVTVTKLQTKMTPDVKLSRSQVIKTLVKEKARKLNGKLKEEKLWKAVLYQGVFEALSFRHNAIPLTDQEKKTTRIWIDLNNTDFKEVCENAGYDPIFIINKIKKVLTSNKLDLLIGINPVVANSILERKEDVR
jgi:hypothetical protein